MSRQSVSILIAVCGIAAAHYADAVELVRLSPATYEAFAPAGKEVDAIYGDLVLRNEHIVAVIAEAKPGRNANMMTRQTGGCVIDLTTRSDQSDQLTAYYVGSAPTEWELVETSTPAVEEVSLAEDNDWVRVRFRPAGAPGDLAMTNEYLLTRGDGYLTVTTTWENTGSGPQDVNLVDFMRMDNSRDQRMVERAPDGTSEVFWIYDPWFGQAYAIAADAHTIEHGMRSGGRSPVRLEFLRQGSGTRTLAPGESMSLTRYLTPGRTQAESLAVADSILGRQGRHTAVHVTDSNGDAIEGAWIEAQDAAGKRVAIGRTDERGRMAFSLPDGDFTARVRALGHGEAEAALGGDRLSVELPVAGRVVARITDADGGPIPCKVQFFGTGETEDPFFGPDSGEYGVHNIRYTADGRFEQALEPGTYEAIVSHGNEYDAILTNVRIERGKAAELRGQLLRTVDTPGWVSTDYHSHSSPSGDNTSSQFGRVLNLLAEHIEFAPCTEHNRISTYVPHLERLGAIDRMATCTGMELTGSPGGLNHQNAFPLIHRPFTQDGGAPRTDRNPETQIERLAFWDNGSEKLVQQNHPDMRQMFFDRDRDGEADSGLAKLGGLMDVIEIHPPVAIFARPVFADGGGDGASNRMAAWLQLVNQGRTVPGVVNTDAHANAHGSGWLRNYVQSSTDDPAQISTLEMVRASEAGRVIMSNGPYLEARMKAGGGEGTVGDTLRAEDGRARLRVRVQCANWLDIDRVQVFVNGRPDPALNFTRADQPDLFSDGVVKFDEELELTFPSDAHVVVAVVGENETLGPVMGPRHGGDKPVAVTNPIYVDVDGGGFTPSQEMLDYVLLTERTD